MSSVMNYIIKESIFLLLRKFIVKYNTLTLTQYALRKSIEIRDFLHNFLDFESDNTDNKNTR